MGALATVLAYKRRQSQGVSVSSALRKALWALLHVYHCPCACVHEDSGQGQPLYLSDSENLKISWAGCLEGIYDQPLRAELSGESLCRSGLHFPSEDAVISAVQMAALPCSHLLGFLSGRPEARCACSLYPCAWLAQAFAIWPLPLSTGSEYIQIVNTS